MLKQSSKKFSLNDKSEKIFPVCQKRRINSLNELNERDLCDNISSFKMCNDYHFIQKLYNERINADVELMFKDGYSEKVHKFVIASHSEYIKKNLCEQTSIPDQLGSLSFLGLSHLGTLGSPKNLGSKSLGSKSLGPKSLGSKHLYGSENIGSLSSLASSKSQISRASLSSSAKTTDSAQSTSLVSSEKTEKIKLFEKYNGECGQLLVELFYEIKINWNKYQLKFIIEALEASKSFDMIHVKNEILRYLNGVFVNIRNFEILKNLCETMKKDLQELHKNLTCFETAHSIPNIQTVTYKVIEGENRGVIENAVLKPNETIGDCTYHKIEKGNKIVLELGELSCINGVKMRLYDQKLRSYSYSIDVSEDGENWSKIVDYSKYQCRSWQSLYFPEQLVKFMRIVGNKCYDTVEYNYFEVTSIQIFKTDQPLKTTSAGILCPNQNMVKSSRGAKLLRGLNTWILDNENHSIHSDSLTYFTYHKPYSDILIQLSQVIFTDNMRIVTWSQIEYEFVINVSIDNKEWNEIYRYEKAEEDAHKSVHEIFFEKNDILFIRIFGENVDDNDERDDTFRVISFKCPDSIM